jgi:Cation transporter/ATPase, N-terminus
LSINVTDTVSHGVEPGKGHIKSISELEWHLIPANEAIRRLRSSDTQGLDNDQVERRLKENGKNTLSPPPTNRIRKTYITSLPRLMPVSVTFWEVSAVC